MEKDFKKIEKEIHGWFLKYNYIKRDGKLRLSQPIFSEREITEVLKVLLLSNGWIAQGPKTEEFEKRFAEYLGVKYAIATNSGSSANLLGIAALMDEGKIKIGDEAIIPASTFPTVVTPILQLGLKPVFVDILKDGNIDPGEVKKALTDKTKLIMMVHTLGKPASVEGIKRIIKGKDILIFEDACEAHGAEIRGKKVGSFGDLASFSFYVAHNMTTGEGGMLVTNDDKLALIARSLREFGRYKGKTEKERFAIKDDVLGNYDTRYLFSRIGYNLRMTDLQAALGIVQLGKLNGMNNKRIKNALFLLKELKPLEKYFYFPEITAKEKHVFYGFLLVIKENVSFKRGDLVDFLEKKGIETRPLFGGCLPDQPAFRDKLHRSVGKLDVSRYFRDNAIFLGCHPGLSDKDLHYLVVCLKDFAGLT